MIKQIKKTKKALLSIVIIYSLIINLYIPSARAEEITISGNNESTQNSVTINNNDNTSIAQTSTGVIQNNITITSSTGGNSIADSTGESNVISTGNVNTTIGVTTEMNSSVSEAGCCGDTESTYTISNNNSNSVNTISDSTQKTTSVAVNQHATVTNNVNGTMTTGANTISGTTGSNTIDSGDIEVTGSIVNGPINVAKYTLKKGTESVETYIKDNNSESLNSITISKNENETNRINNKADIANLVLFDIFTGNNKVSGSLGKTNIFTGDIFFNLFIKNGPLNISESVIDCCQKNDDNPDEPEEPNKPDEPEKPITPPVNGGNGGGGNGGGGNGGEVEGDGIGGPNILGLSDTASPAAQALIFWFGLSLIAFGIRLIVQELAPSYS